MIRYLLAMPVIRIAIYALCGTHILAFLAGKWASRSSRVVHVHYDANSERGVHANRDARVARGSRRKTLDDRVGALLRVALIMIIGYVVLSVTGAASVARP